MTSLAAIVERAPDRPALIMGTSGEAVSFRDLEDASNRFAQLLRARGLVAGDGIAVLLENHPRYFEVMWGAKRTGLYSTTINFHLNVPEVAYIVDDCSARLVVSSERLGPVAEGLTEHVVPRLEHRLMIGRPVQGWAPYELTVAELRAVPVVDEAEGQLMLYSSGTTGRPKGIRRPLPGVAFGEAPEPVGPFADALGIGDGDVYLCPAPLYHAAPIVWSMNAQTRGATVVVMERFDPEEALALIERHRVTHAQFVPTMFVRMLKLDDDIRQRYDVSSLRGVVHAAAPCPPDVKRRMIDWFGPIVSEFWSSTEAAGGTWVDAEDWLAHPGTVGRPFMGELHIRDDDGNELASGEVGVVWAKSPLDFEYHNDEATTAEAHNDHGEVTVGDMGYIDTDGYLYLTDRKSFMIISGGVNIYPQEVENLLIGHPQVADVAVVGVPNDDLGEEVKAVVQPVTWTSAGPELEATLIDFCRRHLAPFKCPRSVDFERELPRLDTGKLYKRAIRDPYWSAR
jgi:acyl-CoA synthetase (AMP-forming)/AMP-acid ligase II